MFLTMLDNGHYDYYMKTVEKVLSDLHDICFGFRIDFADVLPTHMRILTDKEKALQLAQQLSFPLANVSDCTQEQINNAYHWFHEIFYFLYVKCPESDQVFGSLFKLYELDIENREMIFDDWQENAEFLLSQAIAPVSIVVLQKAVLHLISASNQAKKIAEPATKVKDLLKDKSFKDIL